MQYYCHSKSRASSYLLKGKQCWLGLKAELGFVTPVSIYTPGKNVMRRSDTCCIRRRVQACSGVFRLPALRGEGLWSLLGRIRRNSSSKYNYRMHFGWYLRGVGWCQKL
eukprot:1179381-Prorocentrum_minimum.AAC.2